MIKGNSIKFLSNWWYKCGEIEVPITNVGCEIGFSKLDNGLKVNRESTLIQTI